MLPIRLRCGSSFRKAPPKLATKTNAADLDWRVVIGIHVVGLREDKMINPVPGFLAGFRPLGAHGGPRELRERPRLEK